MVNSPQTALDRPLGGLFMMMMMTFCWLGVAEYHFAGQDAYLIGIMLGGVLLYFGYAYVKLSRLKATLPPLSTEPNPKQQQRYWMIFAAEGIAILLAKNILVNLGYNELFIPCFVLIVGLHFFPLAKVFDRTFDYYIGAWTTLVAILGIALTLQQSLSQPIINGLVSTACACATMLYGFKMIKDGYAITLN
ncbi:MAG: hypothetical protein U0Y10_15185 [Spirosomataceae bacterium]